MAATSKPQRRLIKSGIIKNKNENPRKHQGHLNPTGKQKQETKIHEKVFKRTKLKHGLKSELRSHSKEKMGELSKKSPKTGNLRHFLKVRSK